MAIKVKILNDSRGICIYIVYSSLKAAKIRAAGLVAGCGWWLDHVKIMLT